MFVEQTNFLGGLIEQTYFFIRQVLIFPETLIKSFKSLYFLIELIIIF